MGLSVRIDEDGLVNHHSPVGAFGISIHQKTKREKMIKVTDRKLGRLTEIDNVTHCYLDGERVRKRQKESVWGKQKEKER